MKTTAQKNRHPGRVFLAKSKNRPYLAACPVHIVNAEFFPDLKLQKKVMKLRMQNRGDAAVAGMVIYARYLDRDGNVIGAGRHEQLMTSCEEYRHIAKIQMGDGREGA